MFCIHPGVYKAALAFFFFSLFIHTLMLSLIAISVHFVLTLKHHEILFTVCFCFDDTNKLNHKCVSCNVFHFFPCKQSPTQVILQWPLLTPTCSSIQPLLLHGGHSFPLHTLSFVSPAADVASIF